MNESPPVIIMLSGYLQSGKDTIAKHLVDRFGFCRHAFADALKNEVSELYGIPRQLLDTTRGKEMLLRSGKPVATKFIRDTLVSRGCNTTVRGLLVHHGTLRRSQNLDYWVNKVFSNIQKENGKLIVISDWRYPNEYDRMAMYAKFNGANLITCRINRPGKTGEGSSETSLDSFKFDRIFHNSHTPASLFRTVNDTLFKCGIIPTIFIRIHPSNPVYFDDVVMLQQMGFGLLGIVESDDDVCNWMDGIIYATFESWIHDLADYYPSLVFDNGVSREWSFFGHLVTGDIDRLLELAALGGVQRKRMYLID